MNIFRSNRKSQIANRKFPRAFTIIEVMIAIAIFAMVITAIYSTWVAIIRGSRAGLNAAAAVQRSRIAMRTVEDAFLTAAMFTENIRYYGFVTDTSDEDAASISMVSRLPASFPGVGRYGDQIVRRVDFFTQPGTNGANELVMTQAPMLLDPDAGVEPYSLVLARDVTVFRLEFLDPKKNEWAAEWAYTNQLPKLVKVTLGLGKTKGSYSSEPLDEVSRVIALPATAVAGLQAGPPIPVQTNTLGGRK